MTDNAINDTQIRLSGAVDDSIVDGPGIRFAVFTQGCKHGCKGCHNPEAQDFEGGYLVTAEALLRRVQQNPLLAGITLTGGEPFEQADALIWLAQQARELGLTVWAYSGYLYQDLLSGRPTSAAAELLLYIDVLVDGLYDERKKSLDLHFRGSSNQRLIDVPASLQANQVVELQI
jgi:anaerobic ribonucleoside-triphosphate reductase activating protein